MSKTATVTTAAPAIQYSGDGMHGQIAPVGPVTTVFTSTDAQDLAIARYVVTLSADAAYFELTLATQAQDVSVSGVSVDGMTAPRFEDGSLTSLAKVSHIQVGATGTGDVGTTVAMALADAGGDVITHSKIGLRTDPTKPSVFIFDGISSATGVPTAMTTLTFTATGADPITLEIVIAAVHA